MGRLDGKVAIITGAANGMGLAGAQLFAKEGAKVVATDVAFDTLEEKVKEITSDGGDAIALSLDVSDQESWVEVVNKTIEKYGKIDILVNNAGIVTGKGVLESDLENWHKVVNINLTGVYLGVKEVIPHMQKNGGGSIINTSSVAAMMGGDSDGGDAAYSASKGGVRSLTKHIAQWYGGDNIRANSVHPGPIYTNMAEQAGYSKEVIGESHKNKVALKPHYGEPIDIANAYLYLASDESKFVNGLELIVDGGWVSRG